MSFGQPLWFFALALLPALIVLFLRNERKRESFLRQIVAARLQHRLAGSVSVGKRRWRFGLLLMGLACVVASLAQPRFGYTWEESRRKGRDVLIAVDCSRSMLATDLSPNRIGRAKLAVQDLIGQLEGDRVGLIAFAGTSFLQAPLTADYGAVLNSLVELDTDIIPRGGTDIAAAIKEADDAFGKGESENRCLIIFTDGEELEEDAVKAAEAENGAIRIFTVGLGSADGSLIPIPGPHGGSDFVKDEDGQFVKSRLDEDRLRRIAEVTGGFYVHLQSGLPEMTQIVHEGLGKMKEKDIDVKMSRRPIERYQWPLAAGLALISGAMLIGERKGGKRIEMGSAAAATIALLLALAPGSARAKNSGLEAYDREDYSGAQEQFSNQLKRLPDSQALEFDLGAAAYKSGDFGTALESFAKAVTSTNQPLREAAEYNLGNTLYQRGAALKDKDPKIREWKNAIQHYEEAMKIDPRNEDARYNRDLLQRLIDELEKKEQEQKQQKQKDKKDDQKKDDKDKDQQQQQNGQGKQDKQDQQKGSQQSPKDSQQKDQKGSGESKPDQGQQGQPQEKKDGENSPEPKEGEQKNAQNQPKEGKDGSQGKNGDQAKNEPQQGKDGKQDQQGTDPKDPKDSQGKKLSGEIKAPGAEEQKDAKQQEAEEAEAAREGKMTEMQARQLLESLKGEDQRVQLLKPNDRKYDARPFKNW